jgi:hypothetical protein
MKKKASMMALSRFGGVMVGGRVVGFLNLEEEF